MDCFFCPSDTGLSTNGDITEFNCPRCGAFKSTRRGVHKLQSFRSNEPIISGWIREQNSLGIIPIFNPENIKNLKQLRRPSFRERAEKYLLEASKKCPNLVEVFEGLAPELISTSYSSGKSDTLVIIRYLIDKGYLAREREYIGHDNKPRITITPKGFIGADDLRSRRSMLTQAFVAMWFGDEISAIYDEAIEPAISKAGYKALRIDKKEDVVKIDDEILSEIRRSAFIVADFTNHRGGVYFEAGFAMGLDIPIVWTCREDHMKDLHFDIRQYNCLSWKDASDFTSNLQKRIEGYLGRGPLIDHQQVARY